MNGSPEEHHQDSQQTLDDDEDQDDDAVAVGPGVGAGAGGEEAQEAEQENAATWTVWSELVIGQE